MKNLQEKIKKVRFDIESLNREKRAIQLKIDAKKERLKTLLYLTDNQIEMTDIDGFSEE